jgi:hypothetical protein
MLTNDKPQKLVGIKFKDMTPEQKKLYHNWQWAKHGEKEKIRRKTSSDAKDKRRSYMRSYKAERMSRDPEFRLLNSLRSQLSALITQRIQKSSALETILGCPAGALRQHIASQFHSGMTWDNYGTYWHIDHAKPVAAYDLIDPIRLRECFHYTNLRPRFTDLNMRESRDVR